MSLQNTNQLFDELGVQRSHVAIHNWVHKADLQPVSTVSANQLGVDEKLIRLNGDDHWLYAAVDPETNEVLQLGLYTVHTKETTRMFLDELHRRYRLDGVTFLVDCAAYLTKVLASDGYRFQVIRSGNRNAIERVF